MVCWVVEVALRCTCTNFRSARKIQNTPTRPKLTPFNSWVKCYFTRSRNRWKWNSTSKRNKNARERKTLFGAALWASSLLLLVFLNENVQHQACFPFPYNLNIITYSNTHPSLSFSCYFLSPFRIVRIWIQNFQDLKCIFDIRSTYWDLCWDRSRESGDFFWFQGTEIYLSDFSWGGRDRWFLYGG